ncbi:MAG: HAMP domain-containing sensor histidine kinase [Lachnospiraceae bacterium]|nr:HAMP domain-containing sensor histidine kinase [Lachnospiraceae bacterium]
MKNNKKTDYAQFKSKLYKQFLCMAAIAIIIISVLYIFIWQGQGGNLIVSIFRHVFKTDEPSAQLLYTRIFVNNEKIIWLVAIAAIFFILLRVILGWFTKYFDGINQGINDLLNDDVEINLPAEMSAIERKLTAVKQELKQRALQTQLAEQRKNDLVMYLAHDIRTPLTSVIGYLNLLAEVPDMPAQQKAKYVNITLDKAYRLEKMINEFFEITRYNLQQINLSKEPIDLYYMLVQLTDELSPVLCKNGNTTLLKADESLTIYGDPDKLARVFNNVMKNAASYSYPDTEILVSAEEKHASVIISFTNHGKTIPKEKLASLFEKFYRLDESRASNTGGTGLGLAIAKEIITLHGGTITAISEQDTVTLTITLPATP